MRKLRDVMMITLSLALLQARGAALEVKASVFQPTRGYCHIKHRSQKKLRILARRRGI